MHAVSTVTVTAVRGSVAWLPCDIGGGNNDGLPIQLLKAVPTADGEDSDNGPEDRAYMVLWFKHQRRRPTVVRHRNAKFKTKNQHHHYSSGGKPLYRYGGIASFSCSSTRARRYGRFDTNTFRILTKYGVSSTPSFTTPQPPIPAVHIGRRLVTGSNACCTRTHCVRISKEKSLGNVSATPRIL